MAERPILFSAPMVRAILAGTKTQTRRILDPARAAVRNFEVRKDYGTAEDNQEVFICPYGAPGDRLWVRETWQAPGDFARLKTGRVFYRADAEKSPCGQPWKPSIFMPRWASRITLEVTGVRAERLQSIGEEDARAEGVEPLQMDGGLYLPRFEGLWDSINGKRADWKSNPWVWAIDFKRIEQPTREAP